MDKTPENPPHSIASQCNVLPPRSIPNEAASLDMPKGSQHGPSIPGRSKPSPSATSPLFSMTPYSLGTSSLPSSEPPHPNLNPPQRRLLSKYAFILLHK